MEEALIILPRSRMISWPLAGCWCGARELCCPGTGAGEGTLTINSPPPELCCEGCAIHSGTNTSGASGWGVVEDALLVEGGCRDGRRGLWVNVRSQGCPSRAGPALPPPCPVKAIPPVPVTGGAGLYPAQGESVPEAALGREHPWLCTPSNAWVTLGSALFSGSLCPPLPSLQPLHPPTCLSFPGGHEEGGPGSPLDILGELQGPGCPGWRGIPLPSGGTEICPQPLQPEVLGMWTPTWPGCRAGTALDHLLPLRRDE